MKQKTKNSKIVWYVLAAMAVLLAAPNGTVIKSVLETVDPVWFNVLRFTVIACVMLPVLIVGCKRITKRNIQYALLSGIFYAISVTGYTTAISLSQASYVAIINLGIPILLMLFSVYLTKERVSRRSFIGITVAALGASTVVALPVAVSGQTGPDISVTATALAVMNSIAFPLMVIYSRKASQSGLSLWFTLGVAAIVVAAASLCVALAVGVSAPSLEILLRPSIFGSVLFSAVAVSLLARLITIITYQRIGSAPTAGFQYTEVFLAILIPVMVLGERLTAEMVVGGILILVGLLITEINHTPRTRESSLT